MNDIFQFLENPVYEHELEVVSIYQPEIQYEFYSISNP